MAVKRLLNLRPQYDDGNGALASGYRLFFYAAGSSTKQNTYNSSTGLNANTNPIVLNALGEPGVEVWGTVGQTYKIGLAIAGSDDPPASFIWTEDNVSPINDTTITQDEWVSGPAPTYVSATQFTLSGDQTTAFHVGRRVKCTVTAGTSFGTITASAFGALTTVTVDTTGSNPLDSGLSAASYGLLSAANFAQSSSFDAAARQSADIASAATLNLDAAGGDLVDVTGTTTVTAITLARGKVRTVRFTGALTLTNGASLVLPGGANITTAAGDFAIFRGYAGSVVRCVSYVPIAVSAFTTGDVKLTIKTVADAGWVLMNDGTIGSATSGASTRANADTVSLYTLLWNNTANADCAVSTGRGANAAADFAANKTIALPKALGRALATFGTGAGLTARTMGQVVGEENHTLTVAEVPALSPGSGAYFISGTGGGGSGFGAGTDTIARPATTNGGGGAHNNMQPSVFLNVMMKL